MGAELTESTADGLYTYLGTVDDYLTTEQRSELTKVLERDGLTLFSNRVWSAKGIHNCYMVLRTDEVNDVLAWTGTTWKRLTAEEVPWVANTGVDESRIGRTFSGYLIAGNFNRGWN